MTQLLIQPIFLILFFAISYIISRKFFDNDLRITMLILSIFMILGTYLSIFSSEYYVIAVMILILFIYTLLKHKIE